MAAGLLMGCAAATPAAVQSVLMLPAFLPLPLLLLFVPRAAVAHVLRGLAKNPFLIRNGLLTVLEVLASDGSSGANMLDSITVLLVPLLVPGLALSLLHRLALMLLMLALVFVPTPTLLVRVLSVGSIAARSRLFRAASDVWSPGGC